MTIFGRFDGGLLSGGKEIDKMLKFRSIRAVIAVLLFSKILASYVWFGLVTYRRTPKGIRREKMDALHSRNAQRLYADFVRLKGVYIKIGQFLSTQAAFLPTQYLMEMVKMQDQMPTASEKEVRQRIIEQYGKPAEEVFAKFDPVPLACASIGQVHRVTLQDGREAVIKVKYPGIDKFFFADIKVVRLMLPIFVKILEWGFYRESSGIEFSVLIDEFTTHIHLELDYRNEARNQIRMYEQLKGLRDRRMVVVPRLYEEYCRDAILCMEFIQARKIVPWYSDPQVPTDKKNWIFRCLVECLFFTISYYGFFQADTHPGNFMVLDETPGSSGSTATLVMLDFGCTKDFPEGFRTDVVRVVNGYLTRQHDQITDALWNQGFRTRLQTRESFDLWVRQGIRITDEILGFFRDGTSLIDLLRNNLSEMTAEFVALNDEHRIVSVPHHYALLARVLATAPVPLELHMPKVDFLPIAITYLSVLSSKATTEQRATTA
ncbi:MAG: AarF/ABC1/UbiB kinase family protein [Deltaproteobacteria bacterium]|nr:AarF/ABC1/UbiB kinase family protein [Deltaproteobacteria bacterium]